MTFTQQCGISSIILTSALLREIEKFLLFGKFSQFSRIKHKYTLEKKIQLVKVQMRFCQSKLSNWHFQGHWLFMIYIIFFSTEFFSKCEFCGSEEQASRFKRSTRFCTMACAKRYNVAHRMAMFKPRGKPGRPRKLYLYTIGCAKRYKIWLTAWQCSNPTRMTLYR